MKQTALLLEATGLWAAAPAVEPTLTGQTYRIDQPWKARKGDDPRWAAPNFDDSAWGSATMIGRAVGYVWYRQRVKLPPFEGPASVWVPHVLMARHPAPYVDGRELELEAGLPLGLMREVVYEETVVQGDRFTFVSDGVVEAENAQRELFGFERTREISGKSAREIADAAKAWGQTDDITVVTVRRVG